MRLLVLALLLVAAVGAAAVYRVRRTELDAWIGRPRSLWVGRGLVATSVVAMGLIALGLPLVGGPFAFLGALALVAVAASLGLFSWVCVPECLRGGVRESMRVWVGPTAGYVLVILLAAYLVRPSGWEMF